MFADRTDPSDLSQPAHQWNWRAIARWAVWAGLVGLVVFHCISIPMEPNWVPGDDYIFTRSTASGNWIGFYEQVRLHDGRFFPLAFQEFNVLVRAGNAPHLYYAIQVAKYVVTLGIMGLILMAMVRSQRIGQPGGSGALSTGTMATLAAGLLAGVFLLQPRMHLIYGHIIYPETAMMVWLAMFVLLGYRGTRTGGLGNYIVSFLCGSVALYYKEPVFALIFPVAALPLVVAFRSMRRAQRAYAIGLLLSIGLWFGLYYFLVHVNKTGPDYTAKYASCPSRVSGFFRLFFDPTTVYLPMAALAVWRVVAILRAMCRRRAGELSAEQLFVDSLLFGGVLYIAAFATLRMGDIRFLAPCNVFFTVVCFYYGCKLLRAVPQPLMWRHKAALVVAGVFMFSWVSTRLACQTFGFDWLHDIQRTWAPNLRLIAHHSEYPVIYLQPDASAGAQTVSQQDVLHPYFVKATQKCIELQIPDAAKPVELMYLDMDNQLVDTDTLVAGQVAVVHNLPATGQFFLFVPRQAENIALTMRDRYGLDLIRISSFDFEDPYVREIWVTRDMAQQLRHTGWLTADEEGDQPGRLIIDIQHRPADEH